MATTPAPGANGRRAPRRRRVDPGAQALTDAALVHTALRQMSVAVGSLIARPLDEQCHDEIRAALDEVVTPEVSAALSRINNPRRLGHLRLVGAAPAHLEAC